MPAIREKILEAIKTSFQGMAAGLVVAGLPDPFTVTFDLVKRTPLDETDWQSAYTLGIDDQSETKTRTTMFYMCTMPIVLEFYYVKQTGEIASTELNRVLYDVQRWVARDFTWGGLAMNTEQTSCDVYVDDSNQKRLNGAVFINVTYRHFWNDPSRNH